MLRLPWTTRVIAIAAVVAVVGAACAPSPTAAPPEPAAQQPAQKAAAPAKPGVQPAPPAGKPAAASRVVIAIGGDPTTLDPQARDDGNERAVNDNIYETLVARDQTMQLVPALAEKWEQVDATTWRFTLRKGVTFHNGEPFNAAAVEHSVKRIINPELKSEQMSFFETLQGATAVDEVTVDVITKGPDPILPTRMYWMKMVPPKYSDTGEFGEKPVGTGPYKFVEWRRGQQVTLAANEDYWGGAPKVKEVVIRPIKEAQTRLAALKAGEVDVITNLLPEQVGQVPRAETVAGVEFPIIRLNTESGPLADARVRQAMNYAVDKDAIVKALFQGYAKVADGQALTPAHFGYNPAIAAYPYDPNKARELIQQAGATGLSFELVGESGRWLKDKELIEAVAGQFEKVGLKPKVNIQEWTRYLDLLFSPDNQPDAIFVSTSNELFDADRNYSGYFTCRGRVSSYCNEEATRLIEDARTETDVKKREQMYHRAVQLSRDDAAMIYLINYVDIYGLSARLNWKPRADGKILVNDMSIQ